jgi:glycosyltransferase involved in cell wall biosynthesis
MIPVSIALTTYNRGNVLKKTIDSILDQSFPDFELIISDDNSSDDTEAICREYEKKDKRVKYFRNQTNLKMPGNLNAAISRCSGEFIANLHDGDIYRKDLIEKWKSALDKYPEAAFVFNDYLVKDDDGKITIAKPPFENELCQYEIALHYFNTVSCCVWGTVMVRASAYKKYGLFNPEFGFISDVEMWMRLTRYYKAVYFNEPLITLTPREKNHPYAFPHWRNLYWAFGIYKLELENYQSVLPEEIKLFRKKYSKLLRDRFIHSMLVLFKHKKWDRIKEGMAIWRFSNDSFLLAIGFVFGLKKNLPDWFSKNYWDKLKVL